MITWSVKRAAIFAKKVVPTKAPKWRFCAFVLDLTSAAVDGCVQPNASVIVLQNEEIGAAQMRLSCEKKTQKPAWKGRFVCLLTAPSDCMRANGWKKERNANEMKLLFVLYSCAFCVVWISQKKKKKKAKVAASLAAANALNNETRWSRHMMRHDNDHQ